jgi:hypothetical protein
MRKNCYTCSVRKENCGAAKKISPMDWTRHSCALWFPRDDMGTAVPGKAVSKEVKETTHD